MITNNTILVTGGAGFIGSHIATKLAMAEGNEIVIYDNFSTGRKENIAHLMDKANVKVVQADIRDKNKLDEHMAGIDYVFHLAALVSVPLSIDEPKKTEEINTTGTLNVLEAAQKHSVKKVVFSSSAAVYGDDPTLPKVESMPTLPKSPYAETKIAGEDYCRQFYQDYGMGTAALRYFNVFGPRQDPGSEYAAVVPKFIERVVSNQPPIIYGDGEQTRDFIFVDDVVNANIAAAVSDKADGEIFNIASGTIITVNELAKTITNLSGSDFEPIYEPERAGDIKHSYADISKARSVLNWMPETNLTDGLMRTYEFFKTRVD